jgi:hypothetical protein
MKKNLIAALIIGLFPLFLAIESTEATMIIKKSFDQVAQRAELIFEGKVLSKETRPSPVSGKPFTYFTFEVVDIIKGDYSDETIELGFMGGPQGDFILTVSDMRMPEIGEKGIYFVETLSEQQINPLIGWQQGHYLVITNKSTGQDLVVPVEQDTINSGTEALRSGTKALRHEITLEEFKKNIHNVMGMGK